MQTFNYLPGTIINTVDGGLTTSYTPSDDAVLVLGTAGDGNRHPYQVTNLGTASQDLASMEACSAIAEAATYSDNVSASASHLGDGAQRVGADTKRALSLRDSTSPSRKSLPTATRYMIWYAAGVSPCAGWKHSVLEPGRCGCGYGQYLDLNAAGASARLQLSATQASFSAGCNSDLTGAVL